MHITLCTADRTCPGSETPSHNTVPLAYLPLPHHFTPPCHFLSYIVALRRFSRSSATSAHQDYPMFVVAGLTAGLAGVMGDVKSSKEKLDKKMCGACGHDWHWTEIFFLCGGLLGCAVMTVRFAQISFPPWMLALFLVAISGTAAAYVWNLCTQRKLSENTEKMKKEIDKIQHQNEKVRLLCMWHGWVASLPCASFLYFDLLSLFAVQR